MQLIRILICTAFAALVLAGCKKDNLNGGPLAIEPKDFLSARKYEELVIQVCYVDGYKPEQASMDNLKAFLSERLNKPDGISFKYTSISATNRTSFNLEALRDVEMDYRTEYSKGKQLSVWIFFTDAPYSTSNTLGVAYGTTSFAVFGKTVHENSGGLGQPSQTVLETTIAEHEFGHLMGLVDAGTPMTTPHASNQHHCSNSNCLMYYAVETLDIIGNLAGGGIPSLDQNCIADLQANGGK